MNRLRRTLSFRKKNKEDTVSDWSDDERRVREGTCSFHVKYLGCIEVYDSTGVHVCEEAVKLLRHNAKKTERLSFRKKARSACPVLAILYVSGDSLRVVENSSAYDRVPALTRDESQGLIVDQTIEKVSFCAPDRNHSRGFAYICRDGTTRRWMCHGFVTLKETGERLSHAVGCAFAVCLEKKQKREKESVQVQFNADKTSFTRQGSFKHTSLTERMADPQSTKRVETVSIFNPTSEVAQVERPRPSPELIMRQGSHIEFPRLGGSSSAFKRNTSLRLNDLPSNLKRRNQEFLSEDSTMEQVTADSSQPTSWPVGDLASSADWDPITEMCQQLTKGLITLDDGTAAQNGFTSPVQNSIRHEAFPTETDSHWDLHVDYHHKLNHDHCMQANTSANNSNILSFSPPSNQTQLNTAQYSTNPFISPISGMRSTNPFLCHQDTPATTEFVLHV